MRKKDLTGERKRFMAESGRPHGFPYLCVSMALESRIRSRRRCKGRRKQDESEWTVILAQSRPAMEIVYFVSLFFAVES